MANVDYVVIETKHYKRMQQKEYKTRHDWVGKVIHWELCKKFKFGQTGFHPEEWDVQNSLGFWYTNGWPNLGKTTRPSDRHRKKKKRKNLPNCDLYCPGRPQSKIERKRKERDEYLDLAREL